MAFRDSCSFSLLLLIVLLQLTNIQNCLCDCNFFQGSWVTDFSYPLYNATSCPFIDSDYNCQKNGRKDLKYLKYRWQPRDCELQRFDGRMFLKRFEGKGIMFVGDFMSQNHWQSLTCLLSTATPKLKYTITIGNAIATFTFTDYQVKLMYDRNLFLVDLVKENKSRILKLDSIDGGKKWKAMDMLIFNSWPWWTRKGDRGTIVRSN